MVVSVPKATAKDVQDIIEAGYDIEVIQPVWWMRWLEEIILVAGSLPEMIATLTA